MTFISLNMSATPKSLLLIKRSGTPPLLRILGVAQRYTYRVLQTIQMKLIFLCVWAEPAVLGSTKTALKFRYEILIG